MGDGTMTPGSGGLAAVAAAWIIGEAVTERVFAEQREGN